MTTPTPADMSAPVACAGSDPVQESTALVSASSCVPLIDIKCAHCSNAAMHYRLLYSEYVSRMEELSILRRSQTEHSSLVNELHHLRSLFEKQRQQLESMVPPTSRHAANAGLFEYLKTLSSEHQRRVQEMRASFDEKLDRVRAQHAQELQAAQQAARVVDVSKVEAAEAELAAARSEYAAAMEREVAARAELSTASSQMDELHTLLRSKDEQLKRMAFEITAAAADAADDSVQKDLEVANVREKLEVAQQLITSLKSSLEEARRSNDVLEGAQTELSRRLKTSCDQLQECQRTNYAEQQDILKKRDALQIKLFDTMQTVSALNRRVDEMETKLAQQEPYVQVARDMQALMLQLPEEACPALVMPKSSTGVSPTGSSSGKKKKGAKK